MSERLAFYRGTRVASCQFCTPAQAAAFVARGDYDGFTEIEDPTEVVEEGDIVDLSRIDLPPEDLALYPRFISLRPATDAALALARAVAEASGTPLSPLEQYPLLAEQTIAADWAGFIQPRAPRITNPTVIECVWADDVPAICAANPGRIIRVTDNQPTSFPLGFPHFQGCRDNELRVPNARTWHWLRMGDGCLRIRVQGEGPTSRLGTLRVTDSAQHITAHSLTLPGSDSGAAWEVDGAQGPTALILCVGGATEYVGQSIVALIANTSNVLVAGCNLGALNTNPSVNWCSRFACSNVVVADTTAQAIGSQAVLRRNTFNNISYFNTVTVHETDTECISDVGAGGDEIVDQCYLHGCRLYVAGAEPLRFGGYNLSATNYSQLWRAYDTVFHVGPGASIDASTLAAMEANARNPGDWQYLLTSAGGRGPAFPAWNGTHPGWPRVGQLAQPNPYLI